MLGLYTWTSMHAYIYTYVHTYMHACIHMYVHTYRVFFPITTCVYSFQAFKPFVVYLGERSIQLTICATARNFILC